MVLKLCKLFRKNKIYAEYCSTGQQKEIILNILLCQAYALIQKNNTSPIVLLDEICSHLDDDNRSVLLKLSQEFDLQIFMTGTEKNLFSFLSTNTTYCNINDTTFTNKVKAINPQVLRFPGGAVGNFYHFGENGYGFDFKEKHIQNINGLLMWIY